jgi:hypothetical protein
MQIDRCAFMNMPHNFMRILPSSRHGLCPLDLKSQTIGETEKSGGGREIADKPKRLATFPKGTGRKFHRLCKDRPSVRPTRTCPHFRRVGDEIRPGDVVWCPPGVKHWHGATATTAMSHVAIVEKLDGKAVDWMEKVSDQQYGTP